MSTARGCGDRWVCEIGAFTYTRKIARRQTSESTLPFSAETIQIRSSSGDLEICRGLSDVVLLVDGQPSVIAWPAEGLRTEQYFLRAYDTSAITARFHDLPLLSYGIQPHVGLAEQVRPLLEMMADGSYRVELLGRLGPDERRPAARGTLRWAEWAGLHRVASGDPLLVGSVPRELLRLAEDRGNDGIRGVVVLLTVPDTDVSFLLLGHEAMEESQRTGLAPIGVLITYENPRALSPTEHLRHLQDAWKRCAEVVRAPEVVAPPARVPDRVG